MNTDASNVEDTNIHQIVERLSMSCIGSNGERSSNFRIRSFTLFKNDRGLRGRSDSAAVAESISISMTTLLDTGFTVLVFDFHQISALEKTTCRQCSILRSLMSQRPIRVSPYLLAAQLKSSEVRSDFQIRCSPGFSDAIEVSTIGSLARHLSIPNSSSALIFAVTLASPAPSCVLFDITSRQLVELKWLMLNKHKR